MLSLLASLREEAWAKQACEELPVELRAPLLRALSGAPGSGADASLVANALWARVEDGRGWTEPCLREAFCLAQVSCAFAEQARGCAEAAMRHLDMAFIMGGPAEVLQPFVLVVEPSISRPPPGACTAPPPPPHTPPLVTQFPITVLERPTRKEFKAFFDTDTPVVVRGVADSWRAPLRWADLGWWTATHGHRHVPLEVGAFDSPLWHEEVASVTDFCARLAAGAEVVYCAQHTLFEHLPSLRDDFSVPDIIKGRMGSAGTVTPLHVDSYDGLLCQVVGYKHVKLFNASQSPFLYRSSTPWAAQRRWPTADSEGVPVQPDAAARGTISLVDVAAPDHTRFPLFSQAAYTETLLGPGDCLLIPANCWHWVKSCSFSISISFVM